MQTKTTKSVHMHTHTSRYHFTPTGMAIIKKMDNNMLERVWRNQNPHTLLTGIENGVAAMENTGSSSKM